MKFREIYLTREESKKIEENGHCVIVGYDYLKLNEILMADTFTAQYTIKIIDVVETIVSRVFLAKLIEKTLTK